MKKILLIILMFSALLYSQEYNTTINDDYADLRHAWKTYWITHPTKGIKDYGVFHFRKTFDLKTIPKSMVVHFTGDTRFVFYVNEHLVTRGPARGDLQHWRYDTIDIAPFLRSGKNVIAVQVNNFGRFTPASMIHYECGFILQSDKDEHSFVNTDPSWKILKNPAYKPIKITEKMVHGFFAVAPGDWINMNHYPHQWFSIAYDDSKWQNASNSHRGVGRGYMHGEPYYLVPNELPPQEYKNLTFEKVRRFKGVEITKGLFDHSKDTIIPANTTASFLLDQTFLTNGYPKLTFSHGKDASIKIMYGESLFDSLGQKGNRDNIANKNMAGYYDLIIADGGENRTFTPLFVRTFRYVQFDISTADEPLTLHHYKSQFTGYPFKENATFKTDNKNLTKIWDTAWRTARNCAMDTYMDCPYYEQLQYIGDTRVQALISLYVSGDDRLMRKALTLFDDSRIPEGITQSRYPTAVDQYIPPFSLMWIAMVHDYHMHRDDPEFVKQFLPGIQAVLGYFERHLDNDNFVTGLQWLNFTDWTNDWNWGVPPGVDDGQSAFMALHYVYALKYAANLFHFYDKKTKVDMYKNRARTIQNSVMQYCYDSTKGLVAETPQKNCFLQHTNILAILTDTINPENQKEVMSRILDDESLTQTTLYFRFYLFEAMTKTGFGDEYVNQLAPWHNALEYGLTTFPETEIGNVSDIGTRSDCHAWSASPNYNFLATIAGIRPAEPRFNKVKISPILGNIKELHCSIPHPLGNIVVDFKNDKKLSGTILLPKGLCGEFVKDNVNVELKGGLNILE